MPHRIDLANAKGRYQYELLERVIPFWMRNSVDAQHGGFFNCLDRDGTVYDTTKYVWLQGRQVWMLAKLYRTIDAKTEWIEAAENGLDFLRTHALRDDGRVYFALTQDGKPLKLQRKIFSECFLVMALAEMSRALGQDELMHEAESLFERVWTWSFDLTQVGRPALSGQPAAQDLAVPMILLNLIEELVGDDAERLVAYQDRIDDCLRRMLLHVKPDQQRVYETVAPDGSLLDGSAGRLLNPGHAIEAGWFTQHWAQRLGRPALSETARDIVRWSHDTGWDSTYEGLYYFLDAGGFSPTQLEWSMKLWWPHCEALYGHLLNYHLFREEEDYLRFEQIDEYIFNHFADPVHGEWYGYLDRQGIPTHTFKGGPYKGCFHVPRSLWLCVNLLDQMELG